MKKRITSSVLLLLVLAQLASCGGGSGGKDTSAANGGESTVPEETRVWRDSLPERFVYQPAEYPLSQTFLRQNTGSFRHGDVELSRAC